MEHPAKEPSTGKMNIENRFSGLSICHRPECGRMWISGFKGFDFCPHCFIESMFTEIHKLKDEIVELKDDIKKLSKPKRPRGRPPKKKKDEAENETSSKN